MKRLAPALFTLLTLLSATAFAATPQTISYQGQLTDGGGTPLTGVYSITFTIYELSVGGPVVWSEVQPAVNVSGGLFSVTLGSVNPITDNVFSWHERYLGVKVDADPEIAPRTQFTSVAYANRISTVGGASGGPISGEVSISANTPGNAISSTQSGAGRGAFFQISNGANTEAAVQGTHVGAGAGGNFFSDGGGPGIVASATGGLAAELQGNVETYGDISSFDGADKAFEVDVSQSMLRTFGSDGLEQVKIWGVTYGEVLLYDDVGNNMVASLSASSNTGGSLRLKDGDGVTQVVLRGGITGDDAAIMPLDGVNSDEILDEVGVTNRMQENNMTLTSADSVIALRTINAPASGYILAIGTVMINTIHSVGNQEHVTLTIKPTAGGSGFSHQYRVGTGSASANWETPITIHGMFSVSAGANQFTFNVKENQGTTNIAKDGQLTLIYIPTLYGPLTSNVAPAPPVGNETPEQELAASKDFNTQRIEAEFAKMRKQLDAMQAKLDQQD